MQHRGGGVTVNKELFWISNVKCEGICHEPLTQDSSTAANPPKNLKKKAVKGGTRFQSKSRSQPDPNAAAGPLKSQEGWP